LNAVYGEGVPITRLDGKGAGNNFLNLTNESRESVIDGSFNGELDYTPGLGPVDVQVVNPFEVVDGEYILQFTDDDKWFLNASGSTDTIFSDTTFENTTSKLFLSTVFPLQLSRPKTQIQESPITEQSVQASNTWIRKAHSG
jgi:hypothetical protein